jgi:hypothetical protein
MRLHLAITGERIFASKSKVTKVKLDDGQPQIEARAGGRQPRPRPLSPAGRGPAGSTSARCEGVFIL